ncbi:MAG TPA: hybrid sensor histidine kinase/response regulator [Gammaproteobacteria bacterium]
MLVLSPLRRDLVLTTDVLTRAGFQSEGFADAGALVDALAQGGAGMLLVAAEALSERAAVSRLMHLLDNQPAWSDLPVSIITQSRIADPYELSALRELEHLHSVTFLDRPVRIAALVSIARAALQARGRQYQVHALLTAAEDDVRRRDEFLAMLSHELRNPLSAISNAVNVMHLQPDRSARAVRMLERQVDHLTRMVDDLLDVARITSGKVELQKARINLNQILSDAVETVVPYIEEQRHHLDVVHSLEDLYIEGDSARLTQIVANLLHNASKYTEPGGYIRVCLEKDGDEAVLRVRDSGIGLDPTQHERMFDLFVQGKCALDRSQGGLGVGLTIVRRLVRMHGGDVTAASEGPGKGSEFRVRLPLMSDMGAVVAAADGGARMNESCRVLVVDDNPEVADGLALLLEALGHEVRTLYRGRDAPGYARDYRPQVVFLDLGMPDMDGFAVARALQTLPRRAEMTVVATTGYGDDETVVKSRSSGFDRHLLKPARLQALQEILGAALDPDSRVDP